MTIRSYYCQIIGREVEVDTVHYGAQLILSCGEDGAVKVLCKNRVWQCDSLGKVIYRLSNWILICIVYWQGEQTVLIANLNQILLQIDVECDGLLREALNCLKQVGVSDSKTVSSVAFCQFELSLHYIL